jgi:hypothetical protein
MIGRPTRCEVRAGEAELGLVNDAGLQPVDNAAFTAVLACTDATAASVKAMTRRLPRPDRRPD